MLLLPRFLFLTSPHFQHQKNSKCVRELNSEDKKFEEETSQEFYFILYIFSAFLRTKKSLKISAAFK